MIETLIPQGDVESLNRAEAELCKSDLHYLCQVLGFKDWDVCHDDLEKFLDESKCRYKLILIPREHLKTSVVTVAKAIQHILKDPNVSILYASATLDISKSFLSETREYLTNKSDLPQIFGKFESEVWNTDRITVAQRTAADKQATIETAGADKSVTSKHYDVIFADDLVNRQSINTPEQIIKTRKFYSDLFDLLKKPNGILYVIGTRWDDKDLYGQIIREEKELEEAGKPRTFDIHVRKAVEDGRIIFPSKFTFDLLADLRVKKGSYEYSCQYMNEPINREDQQFKPPVRYWTEEPKDGLNFVTVDLAGEEENADFNVITDMVWSKANQLYVLEYDCGHYTAGQMVEKIFKLVERRKPKCVFIEAVAYQRVFLYLLSVEMRKRNTYFSVAPIHPHKDKFTRIMALQPWWEQGNILLKPGMNELEEQFDRFPRAVNDDIIDTVAYAVPVVQGTVPIVDEKAPYAEIKDELSRREWEQRAKDRVRKQEADLPLASIGI